MVTTLETLPLMQAIFFSAGVGRETSLTGTEPSCVNLTFKVGLEKVKPLADKCNQPDPVVKVVVAT